MIGVEIGEKKWNRLKFLPNNILKNTLKMSSCGTPRCATTWHTDQIKF